MVLKCKYFDLLLTRGINVTQSTNLEEKNKKIYLSLTGLLAVSQFMVKSLKLYKDYFFLRPPLARPHFQLLFLGHLFKLNKPSPISARE